MSLFVVNRYEDKEWQKEEEREDTGPQNHLSELLKRIEERKREREAAAKAVEESKQKSDQEQTNKVSKKKGKKKKKLKLVDEESNQVQNGERVNEQGPKEYADNLESKKDSTNTVNQDFTILGSKKRVKTQAVKRVLPSWLAHPEVVNADLSRGPALEEVKLLDSMLIQKLEADGFNKLFPIQARVLAWLLECEKHYKLGRWCRDTCISMPTGSGKTLCYVLPIIQILKDRFVRLIRCLIVLPVQELAAQVFEVVLKFSAGTSLKVALISGASSFNEEQERLVKKNASGEYISGVDIVIATPGRLVDHIRKTAGFSLASLRFLVIDEADRVSDWLQYIPFPHSKAPPLTISNIRSWSPAQKILLSATLSLDPEKLSRLGLFRPILFTSVIADFEKLDKDLNLDEDLNDFTSRYGNPSELTERIVECPLQYKPLAVYQLLVKDKVIEKTLIFTNSCEAAHRLAILLESLLKSKNVTVGEISSQLGSKQREETLEKFVQGSFKVLVCSDALARGLDIPGIKLVVSYDLPKHVKSYIHRAGRTGRGGIPGTAVSLLLPNQIALFSRMLSKVNRSISSTEKEDLDEVAKSVNYESHLENLKETLVKEQAKNLRRQKSHKRMKLK